MPAYSAESSHSFFDSSLLYAWRLAGTRTTFEASLELMCSSAQDAVNGIDDKSISYIPTFKTQSKGLVEHVIV